MGAVDRADGMAERVDPKTGATITEVEWDMSEYNRDTGRSPTNCLIAAAVSDASFEGVG